MWKIARQNFIEIFTWALTGIFFIIWEFWREYKPTLFIKTKKNSNKDSFKYYSFLKYIKIMY